MFVVIVIIILSVGIIATAVLLGFFRRQNKVADGKFADLLKENTSLQEAVHAKEVENALLQAENQTLRDKAESDKAALENLQDRFRAEFKNLANDIFEEKSRQFKQTNKESIDLLLKPFKDNIVEFRERVEKIYAAENEQHGALKAEIKNLMEQSNRVSAETVNLTRALKGNSKVQGDWGEMILDTLLEQSGLQKGIHYSVQSAFRDAEGRSLRPDVVLNLPEGKQIIIDSKVSLTAFADYCAAEDDPTRQTLLGAHVQSIAKHYKELSAKRYQDLTDRAPEFVIMFVPLEPAFMLALQNAPDMWADAYRRNVVITSPTNLLAMLRIVYDLWQRDTQNKNALAIAEAGGRLYDKVAGFVETLGDVEKNIKKASDSCTKAIEQLSTGRGNILSRVENLRTMGAKATKSLPDNISKED